MQRFATAVLAPPRSLGNLNALGVCVGWNLTRASTTSISDDEDKLGRPTTPWVRQVISGVDLLRHPKYNKGLAFTDAERDRLYLRGLLPPAVLSQEVQLERILLNIRGKESDLDKYNYLQSLQERNERLFFRVLAENFEDLLPVVHTPTVRVACQKYGLMFRSLPRSLFITLEDRGRVFRLLKNWPERNVKSIILTDGERVGEMGDLGVQAVGVSISTMSLYTACGGISPSVCMPIVVDVGTDNEELLKSPFYVGVRHRRVRGDAYYDLLDECLSSVRRRFGNTTTIHFHDMANGNASKLLNMYGTEFPCFNDDIQGQAAATLAGILGALPSTGGSLADHTFLFVGEGATGSCIAELLATAIAQQTNQTVLETRKKLWLVDSAGLVVRDRGDSSTLEDYKLPYCHAGPECGDLQSAVNAIKPTVLIGCSTRDRATRDGPGFVFDESICRAMATHAKRPIIFPLSIGKPECSPVDAYAWTDGRAIVATESRSEPVVWGGKELHPAQCSTTYIFPGIGLGAMISRCTKLRDEQFIAAAATVASLVTPEERARGAIYPSLKGIREVSVQVARAVAQKAYEGGYATDLPKPHSLIEKAKQFMYNPQYRRYR